jgi:hypothetical protein
LPPVCDQLADCPPQGNNTILADEMGLGKTVQCVSLVGLLAQHMSVRGPFLVVVPLSTVPNWIKEFRKWVPMVSEGVSLSRGDRHSQAPPLSVHVVGWGRQYRVLTAFGVVFLLVENCR